MGVRQTTSVGYYIPDTFAVSFMGRATSGAGYVAALSEERKAEKYSHLTPTYLFTPVVIESSGAIGPQSRAFLWELGRCVQLESGDTNSIMYLLQRLSVAVQQKNAVGIMRCDRTH